MASDYIEITRTRRGLGRPETAALVKKAVKTALCAEGVRVPCFVDVTLTDDETIHEINLSERGIDRATDVLSFPLNELEPGSFDPERCDIWFGEIPVVRAGGDAGTPEEDLLETVKQREFTIRCDFKDGDASYWVWTGDISHEYVKINADYHT